MMTRRGVLGLGLAAADLLRRAVQPAAPVIISPAPRRPQVLVSIWGRIGAGPFQQLTNRVAVDIDAPRPRPLAAMFAQNSTVQSLCVHHADGCRMDLPLGDWHFAAGSALWYEFGERERAALRDA